MSVSFTGSFSTRRFSSMAEGLPPLALIPSLPSPKSPPKCAEISGRHRLQIEVQFLSSEIGFLEEELQSLEGAQTVSRCCKEVDEFVGTRQDPFIEQKKKKLKSISILRWLRSKLCFNFSRVSCCCGRSTWNRKLICVCSHGRIGCSICRCGRSCSCSNCLEICCSRSCSPLPNLNCPKCSCGCICHCWPKSTEQSFCCSKTCCTSHCLC